MANLNKSDFYYGSVLSKLLKSKINPMLVLAGKDRQVYEFTTDDKNFRLFVKYRSEPSKTKTEDYDSWQFSLTDKEIDELREYLRSETTTSLGLVCGNSMTGKSKYAVVKQENIARILEESKKSLTIGIKNRTKTFLLFVGGGRSDAIKIKTKQLF